MIKSLNLSWRKGGNEPTASELNKLVAKVNEIVYAANNGFEYTAGGESSSSSFDWTSIPSASIYSRGLMTPEMVEKLNNVQTPTLDVLTEVLGDYYVKTEYVLKSDSDYSTSNNPVSAAYVNKYFVQLSEFNAFKLTVPTLAGNNTFTGENTFNNNVFFNAAASFTGHTYIKELAVGDTTVTDIFESKDAPPEEGKESEYDYALTTVGHVASRYLRKDEGSWTAAGNYTFTGSDLFSKEIILGVGIDEDEKETSAILRTTDWLDNDFLGYGVGIYESGGYGYIKTDNLVVRQTAWLRSVTIEETKHIGGETILSCAYCIVAQVRKFSYDGKDYYACFFDKEKNGKEAYQMWEVGDQARLQQTKVGALETDTDSNGGQSLTSRFYWRVVVNCGDGGEIDADYPELYESTFGKWCKDYWFVVLSDNNIEDLGSSYVKGEGKMGNATPEVNDEIVLLGNRCLSPEKNYRRAAQLYSTADTSSSPLRRYYSGIGIVEKNGKHEPFSLEGCEVEQMEYNRTLGTFWKVGHGNTYLQYSDKNGLEAHLNKLDILVNGKTTDVGDAIDGNFKLWTYPDVTWNAPLDGDEPAKKISWDYNVPSSQWASAEERYSHIGDYLVTADGFCYEFNLEGSEYFWVITSDQYLIHAQTMANAAVRTLNNIADDNIITKQEKLQLKRIFDTLDAEYNAICEEAANCDIGKNKACLVILVNTYNLFKSMLSFVLSNLSGDTPLEKDGLPLCATYENSMFHTDYMADTDMAYTFEECYKNYYEAYADLRKAISERTYSFSKDVKVEIDKAIDDLGKQLKGTSGSFQKMNDHLAAIGVYKEINGVPTYSGLVSETNFAALFSSNGGVKSEIATWVEDGIRGATINADQIEMNGNLGVQGLTYRIPTALTSNSADDNILDLTDGGIHVPTETEEATTKFFHVGIYEQAGIKGNTTSVVDAYALNLAKTGSYINLTQTPDTSDLFFFLLPCFVGAKVLNRFGYMDGNSAELFDIKVAKPLVNYFRGQVMKYLGNTIVMEIPPNIGVQFEASECWSDILPLRVGRGFNVDNYDGSIGTNAFDSDGAYKLNDFITVETAWLPKKSTTRYVVMTLKSFKNDRYINMDVAESAENYTNVIGWEMMLFDENFILANNDYDIH